MKGNLSYFLLNNQGKTGNESRILMKRNSQIMRKSKCCKFNNTINSCNKKSLFDTRENILCQSTCSSHKEKGDESQSKQSSAIIQQVSRQCNQAIAIVQTTKRRIYVALIVHILGLDPLHLLHLFIRANPTASIEEQKTKKGERNREKGAHRPSQTHPPGRVARFRAPQP